MDDMTDSEYQAHVATIHQEDKEGPIGYYDTVTGTTVFLRFPTHTLTLGTFSPEQASTCEAIKERINHINSVYNAAENERLVKLAMDKLKRDGLL